MTGHRSWHRQVTRVSHTEVCAEVELSVQRAILIPQGPCLASFASGDGVVVGGLAADRHRGWVSPLEWCNSGSLIR